MKVYILVDIEGMAGVVAAEQGNSAAGAAYEVGRRLMTAETNAAIEGAFAAGATEIVVNDGHGGMRNLVATRIRLRREHVGLTVQIGGGGEQIGRGDDPMQGQETAVALTIEADSGDVWLRAEPLARSDRISGLPAAPVGIRESGEVAPIAAGTAIFDRQDHEALPREPLLAWVPSVAIGVGPAAVYLDKPGITTRHLLVKIRRQIQVGVAEEAVEHTKRDPRGYAQISSNLPITVGESAQATARAREREEVGRRCRRSVDEGERAAIRREGEVGHRPDHVRH